ncbi:hypothetical protein AAMO2058_000380200 [Amorphochlora amoebiformis]
MQSSMPFKKEDNIDLTTLATHTSIDMADEANTPPHHNHNRIITTPFTNSNSTYRKRYIAKTSNPNHKPHRRPRTTGGSLAVAPVDTPPSSHSGSTASSDATSIIPRCSPPNSRRTSPMREQNTKVSMKRSVFGDRSFVMGVLMFVFVATGLIIMAHHSDTHFTILDYFQSGDKAGLVPEEVSELSSRLTGSNLMLIDTALEHDPELQENKHCLLLRKHDRPIVGKLGYGFLLEDKLTFAALWEEYFRQSDPKTWKASVHYSRPLGAKGPAYPHNVRFNHTTLSRVPTQWCNLVTLMFEMLRELLRDPAVHGIMLISDAHVPIKPPDYVHKRLSSAGRSIFRNHFNRGCNEQKCKAEMWWYLVRRDAVRILHEWDNGNLRDINQQLVAMRGRGSRSFPVKALRSTGCPDEKIFAYRVTQWEDSDPEFSDAPIWLTWNPNLHFGSKEYKKSSHKHPATFTHLREKSYRMLRGSCSLFVRKMTQSTTVSLWDESFGTQLIPVEEVVRNEMLHINYPTDSQFWRQQNYSYSAKFESLDSTDNKLPRWLGAGFRNPGGTELQPQDLRVQGMAVLTTRTSRSDNGWIPKGRNLIFTSAGDRNVLDNWLPNLHRANDHKNKKINRKSDTVQEEPNYDIFLVYYGSDVFIYQHLKQKCRWVVRMEGTKFTNFYNLVYNRHPELFRATDYFFMLDDDITFENGVNDINKMFRTARRYHLRAAMPSFSHDSRLSWPITKHDTENGLVLAYTNFVEVNCPLISRDAMERLMDVFHPNLIGWGIDYLLVWANGMDKTRSFAVVHEIQVKNPQTVEKSGKVSIHP